jgi:ATP synthase delta/epsilon subunit-like protein
MSDDPQRAVDEKRAIDPNSDEATRESKSELESEQAANELSIRKGGETLTMHVKVYSPFRDYYDGQAFSLSAVNLTGPFDILPKHHNFISLLTACELLVRALVKGEQQVVRVLISGGIIHVKADEVIVFLDV